MAESLHILLGTSACLQWLCHSGERTVAHGPLVLSSDFLKFFHLGQFLSNYWSYRVIFGTCEVFVFRSVSQ